MTQTTEIYSKASRFNMEILDLDELRNAEITAQVDVLPVGSIFRLGGDFSSALSDVMKIRDGVVTTLLTTAKSTDMHFCRSQKARLQADKGFSLLTVNGQNITVENTSDITIKIVHSHLVKNVAHTQSITRLLSGQTATF